jgi:hypothetical protein
MYQTVDLERLSSDLGYWLEKDPSNGEATHYEQCYEGHQFAWVRHSSKGTFYWHDYAWVDVEKTNGEMGDVTFMLKKPSNTWPQIGEEVAYNKGDCFVTSKVIGKHELWLWLDVPQVGLVTVQNVPGLVGRKEPSDVEKLTSFMLDSVNKEEFGSIEWAEHAQRVVEQVAKATIDKFELKEK